MNEGKEGKGRGLCMSTQTIGKFKREFASGMYAPKQNSVDLMF